MHAGQVVESAQGAPDVAHTWRVLAALLEAELLAEEQADPTGRSRRDVVPTSASVDRVGLASNAVLAGPTAHASTSDGSDGP